MKKQNVLLVMSVGIMLGIVSLSPVNVSAATFTWSDDFNDGNYDGWTVVNGTWSASGNYLKATGSDGINTIYCESNARCGNFSFDIYIDEDVPDVENFDYVIYFSCDDNLSTIGPVTIPKWGHCVEITQNQIYLYRLGNYWYSQIGVTSPSLGGWHSIDVTIMSNYTAKMWVDGELKVDSLSLFTDTIIKYFYVSAPENGAIDNIVVDGEEYNLTTIVTSPTTTETTTTTSTATESTTTTAPATTPTTTSPISGTTTTTTETTTTTPPPPDLTTLLLVGVGGGVVLLIVIVLVLKKR